MDADSNEKAGATRDLFVVFDGPPSHESGRFVELEDAEQRGVGGVAEWVDRGDGYWTLGPFRAVTDPQLSEREREALRLLARGHAQDRSGVIRINAGFLYGFTEAEWKTLAEKLAVPR